jgi:hypothetical protein
MLAFRFSMLWLLGLVALAAMILAGLLFASPVVVSIGYTLNFVLLLSALPAILYRTEGRRAFWIGFALFGWSYLIFIWTSSNTSRLLTMQALQPLHSSMKRTETRVIRNVDVDPFSGSTSTTTSTTVVEDIPVWHDFMHVGHQGWTILLALLGGCIARWFWATKNSTSRAIGPPQV